MDKGQVEQAVRGLDPNNDGHWTMSGLPSTEAVGASRAEISDAMPGYDRYTARGGDNAGAIGRNAVGERKGPESGGSVRSSPADNDIVDVTESTAAQEARAAAAVKQGLAGRHSSGDSKPFDMMDEFCSLTSAPEYRRNQIFQQIRTLWAQSGQEALRFQQKHDRKVGDREDRMAKKREGEEAAPAQ